MKTEIISIGSKAHIETYIQYNYDEIDQNRKRPGIIICPGGGYEMTSDREAEAIAIKMLSYGYQAFVLRYSVYPSKFPDALFELATTLSMIRANKERWHIDENKLIVCGFSAGGHLAASLGVFWNHPIIQNKLSDNPANWKPNGLLLCYPVISSGKYAHRSSINNLLNSNSEEETSFLSLENQVSHDTPPTFIWHTVEDQSVPVENSLLFTQHLQAHDVSFELHIFPKGGHGLSLANEETNPKKGGRIQNGCAQWPDLFHHWMKNNYSINNE